MVAQAGIIQMPMKKGKKRVHRFVVLPDYQGIGIGTKFITAIAKIISDRGFEVNLTTSTPSLVPALRKSKNWILARYGRDKSGMRGYLRYGEQAEHLTHTVSSKRITYSFWYK